MMTRKAGLLATAVVLAVCMTGGIRMCEAQGSLPGAPGKKQLTVQEIKKLRKKSAHRKRRIIFHSDGKPMDSPNMIFPYIPGTQT